MEDKKKNALTVLFINIVLSLILTGTIDFTCPFNAERIVIIGIFYLVLLVVFPLFTYFLDSFNQWVNRRFQNLSNGYVWIRSHLKKVFQIVLIYAGVVVLSVVATYFYSKWKNSSFNWMIAVTCIGLLYILVTCYLLRKDSPVHPEHLFLALVIGIGSLMIIASPVTVGVSWDDQIHYEKAEVIPNIISGKRPEADEVFIHNSGWKIKSNHFTKEKRVEADDRINTLYRSGKIAKKAGKQHLSVETVAFLPYDAGIIIGRCFRLPFTITLCLAKIINLITYACVVATGAKKLKAGKMLALMIGMIPTVWFMAMNFSYDPWLICWTLYGFSCFLEFYQDKDKKMTGTDMVKIIGSYVIGCLPKAVYLVLMFPLLFMPPRVFKNSKQHRRYIALVILGAVVLMGTFALPMLFHGAGTGDARGGKDVNATEQLKLVLSNPGWYAGMLSRFLVQYVSPLHAPEYLQNYASYGMGKFGTITTILYAGIAVFDKNGEKSKRWSDALVAIFTFLVCMAVVASALYITFTPVGMNTVKGCQYRYIIPALALLLYMIVPDRIRNPIRKDFFVNVPMMFVAGTFLANIMYCLLTFY